MNKILPLFLLVFFSHNLLAQSKKEEKAEIAENEFVKTKKLIDSEQYTFNADWAITSGGRRINLIGNPNYVKINKDSVDVVLPYFGVAHSANPTLGGDGGIKYNGTASNYKVKVNDKKKIG